MENQLNNNETPPIRPSIVNLPITKRFTIFLILLISIGVSSYIYVSTHWSTSNNQSIQTVEEFADWKTYRNDEYGFEFKYPSDWREYHANNSFSIQAPGFLNGHGISVSFSNYPMESSVDEWIDKTYGDSIKLKTTVITNTVNNQGHNFINIAHLPDETDDTMVSINKESGKVVQFGVSPYSVHSKIYNQILSTFKFINATSTDISTWKTYRNEEYRFEFKYPGSVSYKFEIVDSYNNQKQITGAFYNGDIYLFSFRMNGDFGYSEGCDKKGVNENIIIDGIKMIKENNCGEIVYYFQHNEQHFFFGTAYGDDIKILDSVLSTFKFTN